MAVGLPRLGDAKEYNYSYDQLNRLVKMDAYGGLTNTGFAPVLLPDYKERISYDPNGNILTYLRNGTTAGSRPLAMDNLAYHYKAGTNQLDHVSDDPSIAATNYTEDIDTQNPGHYSYDAIGNLIGDGTSTIEWTVYGKIASVTKSSGTISYSYDASGNRISKATGNKQTFYVRDASGNVMGVYEKEANTALKKTESHLYGSSRLGIAGEETTAPVIVALAVGYDNGKVTTFTRGETYFELSNHLGNVLATVSDRKLPVASTTNSSLIDYYLPDVVGAQDYYPFGMTMPGRKFSSGNYRYAFNSKEDDPETGTQDYGFRIYNPALGRFLSVDPLTKKYPWYTPYQFAGNKPIKFIDLDGAEEYDPQAVPKGITYLSIGKAPGITEQTKSIYIGNYELRGIWGENGAGYWIARYHYKEGKYKGMYNDEWLVGPDGVYDLARHSEEYHNKAEWISELGGVKDFSLTNIWKGYKEVISNPLNWIAGANILASSYKSLLRGKLGDVEAREWYLAGERKIPSMLNTKLPLEEQAKQAFNIRNQLRTEARELMSDRAKASRLNIEEPNMTWEQVVDKYKNQGFKGDDLWQKIIESSQKSRQSVNQQLNVNPKK